MGNNYLSKLYKQHNNYVLFIIFIYLNIFTGKETDVMLDSYLTQLTATLLFRKR